MIRDRQKMNEHLDRIRTFVRDVAIPNEDRVELEDHIPEEVINKLKELGSVGWSFAISENRETATRNTGQRP